MTNVLFAIMIFIDMPEDGYPYFESNFAYYSAEETIAFIVKYLEKQEGRRKILMGKLIAILIRCHKFTLRKEKTYTGAKKFWAGSVMLMGVEDIMFLGLKLTYHGDFVAV